MSRTNQVRGRCIPSRRGDRERLARAAEIEGEQARERVVLGNVGRPAIGGGAPHRRAAERLPPLRLTTAPLLVYTPTAWRGCSCGNVGSLPRSGSPRSSYGRCRGRCTSVVTDSNTDWRFVVEEVCVLRFDNETGKGDHKHVGETEVPYRFTTLDRLIEDFWNEVEGWQR